MGEEGEVEDMDLEFAGEERIWVEGLRRGRDGHGVGDWSGHGSGVRDVKGGW